MEDSVSSTPIPSQTSMKFAESYKLEDQINLQHLVELMTIFHVRLINNFGKVYCCYSRVLMKMAVMD